MLDLFYDSIPKQCKKRVHFHAFMLYLYSEINKWNLCSYDGDSDDYVAPTQYVVDNILDDAWLICFDEVQLADYGANSLLRSVFEQLFARGAVVVATSNRPPEDLGDSSVSSGTYDSQISEMLPEEVVSFKTLLRTNCESVHLDSVFDYRTSLNPGKATYFYPTTVENDELFDKAFGHAVGAGHKLGPAYIKVYGRNVLVPIASKNGVARYTFKELCQYPLGPADYIILCNNYHTIFLERIPKMGMYQRNEARRLLSFIDAAYESRTKVFCSAEVKPEELFAMLPIDGDSAKDQYEDDEMYREMMGEIAFDLKMALDFQSLGFISGEDEIFSFRRAISRLKEMQSILYQMSTHKPQTFVPYVGTAEEQKNADERRKSRKLRWQQKLEAEAEAKEGGVPEGSSLEKGDKSEEASRNDGLLYKETDWGDEASYTSWSQTIMRKIESDSERERKVNSPQGAAPKFGPQHFWGFGWWEKVVDRMGKRKSKGKNEYDDKPSIK